MTAHYVTLTPGIAPMAYLSFALEWISCIICIVLSIRFYMQHRGNWWLIAAIAFCAPLLTTVFYNASLGLLPLPYGVAQVQRTTTGVKTLIELPSNWDFIPPLMAIGMGVAAYENSLKRRPRPTAESEKTPEPSA